MSNNKPNSKTIDVFWVELIKVIEAVKATPNYYHLFMDVLGNGLQMVYKQSLKHDELSVWVQLDSRTKVVLFEKAEYVDKANDAFNVVHLADSEVRHIIRFFKDAGFETAISEGKNLPL